MWGKLSVGLALLLGIFLVIRNLFRGKETPNNIEGTFKKVFKDSDYKASMQNWLDVSRMETAGWNSPLFINGLNLWGMKKARKRPNTQESTLYGTPGRDKNLSVTGVVSEVTGQSQWAKYGSLEDSVRDIILWMDYTKFPNGVLSLRDHVEEMKKRSYFVGEDVSEYLGKIIAWKNRA